MVTSIRSPKFDMSKDCFTATVFYGDSQVRKDRVQIEMLGRKPIYALRLTADQTLQHPVAKVTLKAECGYNFTRFYTIFAQPTDRAVPDETSVGATTSNQDSAVKISAAKAAAARSDGLKQNVARKAESMQTVAQMKTLGEVCATEDPKKTLSEVCNAKPEMLSQVQ